MAGVRRQMVSTVRGIVEPFRKTTAADPIGPPATAPIAAALATEGHPRRRPDGRFRPGLTDDIEHVRSRLASESWSCGNPCIPASGTGGWVGSSLTNIPSRAQYLVTVSPVLQPDGSVILGCASQRRFSTMVFGSSRNAQLTQRLVAEVTLRKAPAISVRRSSPGLSTNGAPIISNSVYSPSSSSPAR